MRIATHAKVAAAIATVLSTLFIAFLVYATLRNGTHAVYCPESSRIGFLPCVPTIAGITSAVVLFSFAWPIAFLMTWPLTLAIAGRNR